jgi:hypothetical protein
VTPAAAPRDDPELAASATATATDEARDPSRSAAAASPSPPSWEDLYIIPSSFSDDDHGDDDDEDDEQHEGAAANGGAARAPGAVRAWPGAGPIVLLPGFGNDTEDYEAPFGQARRGLAPRLRRRGFVVETVRLRRREWLRVARAVASPAFWRGEADVGPGYRWYLVRVAAAVRRAERAWAEAEASEAAAEADDGDGRAPRPTPGVTLVGHSAGGWLARGFIGDASLRPDAVAEAAQREEDRALAALDEASRGGGGALGAALATAREVLFSRSLALEAAGPAPRPCVERPHPSVGAVVTLGTPHTPPVGGRDVTGGALAWVNDLWPGAYFGAGGNGGAGRAAPADGGRQIVYVTVAGRAVLAPPSDVAVPRGSPPSYAREAYKTVAGSGVRGGAGTAASEAGKPPPAPAVVVGDAVVPLSVASGGLPGADARVVLDGVWHSMSRLGTFKDPPSASAGASGGGEGGGGGGAAKPSDDNAGAMRGVRPWYGSGGALDAWLAALRDAEAAARGGGERI